jgi:hypothetical protein
MGEQCLWLTRQCALLETTINAGLLPARLGLEKIEYWEEVVVLVNCGVAKDPGSF